VDQAQGFEEPTWGQVGPTELERIVVLSPHFDDAAMGAGQMLLRHGSAQTAVITVLGGRPPAYPDPPSPWDALGGFRAGDDVVGVRREEDRAAMEVLGADPVWLDFPDHQYLAPADRPRPEEVAPTLEAAIAAQAPAAVFVPMGLANPDHVMTHEAALIVRLRRPEWAWFAYEDHGYKHLPGMLAWRVSKLFRSGLWPTPALVPVATDTEVKRKAIWCYASQIPPLEQDHALTERLDANVPEQFWRLAPPPHGWEALVDV
jgi:LmbE family N-acetylglucosaminyl deacetylase